MMYIYIYTHNILCISDLNSIYNVHSVCILSAYILDIMCIAYILYIVHLLYLLVSILYII